MRLVLDQLGRFIFVRYLLGALVLVVLLYVEEDWRGASAWAATKAEWEAKGESFDRAKFVPPPVPDEQNLATLPLFNLELVTGENGEKYLSPVALKRALRSGLPGDNIPPAGSWMTGGMPDMVTIRGTIAADYAAAFKDGKQDAKPPGDALAQFDALYPVVTDLVAASASRPIFRLNEDYLVEPPGKRPFGAVTEPLRLAKVLSLHAILALDEHRSDLAMADLRLIDELFRGAGKDPSLVGGFVALGIFAIGNAAIYDGLTLHAWSDAQLAEMEEMLKPIDLLANYQFALRGELVFCLGNLDFFRAKKDRDISAPDTMDVLLTYAPDGWWDLNESHIATFYFHQLAGVDPEARRAYPAVPRDLYANSMKAVARWDALAPWNIYSTSIEADMSHAMSKFAQGQVWVDQTRIACALERYRLAKGIYPEALGALAPTYIEAVPQDIMSGEAYRYRLRADGTFSLYSVGWNETDEGATVVFESEGPTAINYEEGDWVWPVAKVSH